MSACVMHNQCLAAGTVFHDSHHTAHYALAGNSSNHLQVYKNNIQQSIVKVHKSYFALKPNTVVVFDYQYP